MTTSKLGLHDIPVVIFSFMFLDIINVIKFPNKRI
jgi:hypothetical protein